MQLFVTCLVEGFFPGAVTATRIVLERAGCEVDVPAGQTCCGQPAFNAGLVEQARRLARRLVEDLGGSDGPVIVPSGSCADMIIHHVPELLASDSSLAIPARELAGRVRELTAFLVDDLAVRDLGASCPARVAYHPSCHGLRNLGLRHQATALLSGVDGLEQVEIERAEECCGFGGLFSVELPEVSAAILAAKLDRIEETGADLLVGGDAGCLLHLEGGLHRRGSAIGVRHISQVLAGS